MWPRALDHLGPFLNVTDWLEGLVKGIYYGDLNPVRVTLPHPESDWWEENPDVRMWSYNEILRLLNSYNVTVFWRGFDYDHIWGHVKRKQARWAEYILHRAGAIPPVTMQTVDGRNVGWATNPAHGGKLPTRWADRQDPGPRGRRSGRSRRGRARRRDVSMWF